MIKISRYIDDISSIYRVSMSIDTIYSIDNRVTEISAKNRKYRQKNHISVWGKYIGLGVIYRRYIGNISDFIKKIQKKNNI